MENGSSGSSGNESAATQRDFLGREYEWVTAECSRIDNWTHEGVSLIVPILILVFSVGVVRRSG